MKKIVVLTLLVLVFGLGGASGIKAQSCVGEATCCRDAGSSYFCYGVPYSSCDPADAYSCDSYTGSPACVSSAEGYCPSDVTYPAECSAAFSCTAINCTGWIMPGATCHWEGSPIPTSGGGGSCGGSAGACSGSCPPGQMCSWVGGVECRCFTPATTWQPYLYVILDGNNNGLDDCGTNGCRVYNPGSDVRVGHGSVCNTPYDIPGIWFESSTGSTVAHASWGDGTDCLSRLTFPGSVSPNITIHLPPGYEAVRAYPVGDPGEWMAE